MALNTRSMLGFALAVRLCFPPVQGQVFAAGDARYAAIERLGELNGVALQCRYIEQVRRMKSAVVLNAPKERSFGLAFDQATNRSFLAFIQQNAVCPAEEALARDVGHQINALQAAFDNP